MESTAQSTLIVDLNAFEHNIRVVKKIIPGSCVIMQVLKANAYGHGSVAIAHRAIQAGVAMLGVATVEEALVLRAAEINAPILVMVQPPAAALHDAVNNNLRLLLSDARTAEQLGEIARKHNKVIPIHCKIDTGMGREGLEPGEAVAAMRRITRVSHIDIEGVATHFSSAEYTEDPATNNQITLFKQMLKLLEREGIPYEIAHAANSAGVVAHPNSYFDMVRPGLMTYGVWPTVTPPEKTNLRPVCRWETRVILIKNLPPERSIGYGRTFVTERATKTAVLPVGYADGYKTQLGNNADILIKGRRCPVRGRVSMDQIVVDITDVPNVAVGDTAVLIGPSGSEEISVAELAGRANVPEHDILTSIGQRVHRTYNN